MNNKPLLQEIDDLLEGVKTNLHEPWFEEAQKSLTHLREFKESVDVEALDDARKRYINQSGYTLSGHDAMLFFKAATKLREIVGDTK